MSVRVRPATAADVEAAAALITEAREKNPFDWACYPKVYETDGRCETHAQQEGLQELINSREEPLREAFAKPDTQRFWVATCRDKKHASVIAKGGSPDHGDGQQRDTTFETIVGIVTWQIYPIGTTSQEWEKYLAKPRELAPWEAFVALTRSRPREIIGDDRPHIHECTATQPSPAEYFSLKSRPCVGIEQLYVSPDHRKRGIATQLAKAALDEADRLGLPIYLEATPEGGMVYHRPGWNFQSKGVFTLDLSPWGIDADYENNLFWREPHCAA